MTERRLDKIEVATRVLTSLTVPIGLLFALAVVKLAFRTEPEQTLAMYPVELSNLELVMLALFVVLVPLAAIMPMITLRRELQKQKSTTTLVLSDQ